MTSEPDTPAARGWDQATYRCGRCGAAYTVTTEEAYLQAVGVHTDAHAVWDRLNPIERDGFTSILRTILSAPELGFELLALADRQQNTGGDTSSPTAVLGTNTPQPDCQGGLVAAPANNTFTALSACFSRDLAALISEEAPHDPTPNEFIDLVARVRDAVNPVSGDLMDALTELTEALNGPADDQREQLARARIHLRNAVEAVR
ncbi:hypothetical protein [Streptomyces griseoruber]|uniref:hypothetical protein n=1 Tax=Streptomyces griseoruber TaxID=1943 RepID=UPI000A92CA77|nr:hypothetical protein [Streptomyces griseoruber]